MKISIQEGLLPGDSLTQRLDFAEELGVEGVEFSGWSNPWQKGDELEKAFRSRRVKFSSVCGQSAFDFLDPDPIKRRASIEESKKNLELCGRMGAAGQIVPPIFGPPRINDLSPLADALTLEKNLLAEITKELAAYAAQHNTLFLLEPLNRYEQHLLRKQSDGLEIIKKAGEPKGVGLLSDFFHMHIEETNTPEAFRQAGKWVAHVHVADNTRLEPGSGDIDWKAGIKALRDINFKGYLAYECSLSGEKGPTLRKSVKFLRDVIASV